MGTKTSATWATATTVAPSQGTSSNVSAEESKPTQTVSYSNSDEKDPFQNTTLETKSAKKKPNLRSIICSYFFTVGYHLTLWTILAAIGFPFFLYFADPSATGKPIYYGYGSLIGIYPKLNLMVPYELFDTKDNLIHLRFNRSTYELFQSYYKNNESVIVYYNSTIGRDCFNNYTLGDGSFCNALLLDKENKDYQYGECSEFVLSDGKFYNFEKGNNGSIPCLMLKFNKILDYVPYRGFDQNCKNISGCCDKSRVEIKCSDSELVEVYPKNGVSICQWPFKGNSELYYDSYHSPMAMLKIKGIPKHSTKIQCYAVLEEGTEWSDKEEFFTTGPHTLTFVIDP